MLLSPYMYHEQYRGTSLKEIPKPQVDQVTGRGSHRRFLLFPLEKGLLLWWASHCGPSFQCPVSALDQPIAGLLSRSLNDNPFTLLSVGSVRLDWSDPILADGISGKDVIMFRVFNTFFGKYECKTWIDQFSWKSVCIFQDHSSFFQRLQSHLPWLNYEYPYAY